jgi:hypothetical protein
VCRASYTTATLALPVLIIICSATARCLTANQAMVPDLHSCHYSNQIYDSDASAMRQRVPTHFTLMSSRYVDLVQAARGYHCSGTATVSFNGHDYIQTAMGDDPGIPVLIPMIASLTGLPLADTFDLTTFAVVALGILIGFAGFWRLYPHQQVRWAAAAVFLCLGLLEAKVADFYIFQVSPLMAGIPWILHFGLSCKTFALNMCAALLAFCCSWFSFARTGTTLICLAFLIPLFACRYRVQRIFPPLLLIILACVPAQLVKQYLITHRDIVLARLGETATSVNSHMIWHSIYVGLAFIPNSEVPQFNDAVAANKVRSIDPAVLYTSAKYELILRRELFGIARHRPMLLIENLAAKTGIIAVLASILLLPARRFLFADREVFWLDSAFVAAMVVSAMNAILVIPKLAYLLTFFCLTCLYSLVKVGGALSSGHGAGHPVFGNNRLDRLAILPREWRKKVFR